MGLDRNPKFESFLGKQTPLSGAILQLQQVVPQVTTPVCIVLYLIYDTGVSIDQHLHFHAVSNGCGTKLNYLP